MPYYSRYRRRTGFARYRRRYAGYRRRYYRRRSSAGSTSSRSRCRVVVKTQKVVTLTIPAGSRNSNLLSATPYYDTPDSSTINGCAGACGSPLYQAYANLYDSVKCDGVISRISIISPVGGSTGAVSTALTIVSAYDRMGTRGELTSSVDRSTLNDLLSYSTVQSRTAINNSVAKTARSCWASDIQERTMFHDCSFTFLAEDSVTYDQDWYANQNKLTYFAPAFWCGVQLAAATSTQATNVNLLLEQVYYMTFRSPKFGVSQSASGAAAVRRAVAADDALAAESLDSEDRVYVRAKSGYTPPKKQPRSSVAAMMEAGLDDPSEVTPHLLESLAERSEAMDDPDYVGEPKGVLDHFDDEEDRTALQINLRRGKQDADRWHARHDGEVPILTLPRGTPRVVPPASPFKK